MSFWDETSDLSSLDDVSLYEDESLKNYADLPDLNVFIKYLQKIGKIAPVDPEIYTGRKKLRFVQGLLVVHRHNDQNITTLTICHLTNSLGINSIDLGRIRKNLLDNNASLQRPSSKTNAIYVTRICVFYYKNHKIIDTGLSFMRKNKPHYPVRRYDFDTTTGRYVKYVHHEPSFSKRLVPNNDVVTFYTIDSTIDSNRFLDNDLIEEVKSMNDYNYRLGKAMFSKILTNRLGSVSKHKQLPEDLINTEIMSYLGGSRRRRRHRRRRVTAKRKRACV